MNGGPVPFPLPAEGPAEADERLNAHWAVLGKYPGRTMGYEVLGGSLPEARAKNYLWGAAAVGAPDERDEWGALPWRVFLSGVQGEAAACAVVETAWDGSRDGTGAASYAWRLLLLDWTSASAAAVTWSTLDRTADTFRWPVMTEETPPVTGSAVAMDVRRTAADEHAQTIDGLGFNWAAGVAALLLDGRPVALVPRPGDDVPGTAHRVRILDAICSLLPYGCRVWLSAATWTGRSDHDLMLVFAPAARGRQLEVRLDGGSPPQPQSHPARTYLAELFRLRERGRTTADLVGHLLAEPTPIAFRERGDAVRVLKDLDLLDSVIEDINQDRGAPADVRRVLERHPPTTLDERRLAILVVFLARKAIRDRLAGHEAAQILFAHWSPLTPGLIAQDVLAARPSRESFGEAAEYLALLRATGARQPGAFEELFRYLVDAPGQDPEWVAGLIRKVERDFAHHSEVAAHVLAQSPAVAHAWLGLLLERRKPELSALEPVVRFVLRRDGGTVPGWLRFGALLTGDLTPDHVTESDAAEFTARRAGVWRIALEGGEQSNRPARVSLLFRDLLQVVQGPDRRDFLSVLHRLAPLGRSGLGPATAADADLLEAAAAAGGSQVAPPSMPRLRHLAGTDEIDTYASALKRRIASDAGLGEVAVDALLGGGPDERCWTVLLRLGPEPAVCNGIARRISGDDYADWLDLGLSADMVEALARYGDLRWLPHVLAMRRAVRSGGSIVQIVQIVYDACPDRRFPRQLAWEVLAWMAKHPPAVRYELVNALDRRMSNLGVALCQVIGSDERAAGLREPMLQVARIEEDQARRRRTALEGVTPRVHRQYEDAGAHTGAGAVASGGSHAQAGSFPVGGGPGRSGAHGRSEQPGSSARYGEAASQGVHGGSGSPGVHRPAPGTSGGSTTGYPSHDARAPGPAPHGATSPPPGSTPPPAGYPPPAGAHLSQAPTGAAQAYDWAERGDFSSLHHGPPPSEQPSAPEQRPLDESPEEQKKRHGKLWPFGKKEL
ncbi:hypothetical protein ACFXOS_12635 [Streptomyces sp. NPDC059175]|uniref:hypothetical protein n=1 Tax=Streptomyces sp. NPDC059175 TaxID=3346757 RepID=UPI0036919BA6